MKRIAVITGASSGMGRRFAETCSDYCNSHFILHVFLECCTEDEFNVVSSCICDHLCSCVNIFSENVF